MAAHGGRGSRLLAPLCLAHAALGTWAVHAWRTGPFRGAAVLDGAEVLHLATTGRADVIDTKSPLYPWLLGLALRADADVALTTGVLGVLASVLVLVGLSRLCGRLGLERAEPWALLLYVLSGSVLAFVPQPLPVLPGTALLLWGTVMLAGPAGRALSLRDAVAGGALLAAAVLTLAALLPAALLVAAGLLTPGLRTAGQPTTGRRVGLGARWAACSAGAAATVVLGALVLPGSPGALWPEGSGLNLRLGNGGTRSGIPDIRPGPAYDRLRLEPVAAAWEAGAGEVDADAFHRAALARELLDDPAGALATLVRKLALFFHRTEIVTGADFRHALSTLPPLHVLLLSFGLVAPLALASLRLRRDRAVWLPVLGVLLANVLWLTSARYRFPALPFLCVAAGLWIAARPPRRELLLALGLVVLLNVPATARALTWPGDGELQEGDLLLAGGYIDPAAAVLAQATQHGRDPRAAFLLGMACERAVALHGDLTLRRRAEDWYREALAREPLYPEAADALMRVLLAQQRAEEALAFGEGYLARDAWGGTPRLTLAAMTVRLGDKPRTRELLLEGHRLIALAALSHNDRATAAREAIELLRLNAPDKVLDALVAEGAH